MNIASTRGPQRGGVGPAGRRVNKGLGSPIRPAKGVLSFLHKNPLVFLSMSPHSVLGGLGGDETGPTCFVPEPPG